MKHCKLCKRPASEVDIVHKESKYSSLSRGYCLDCQEWVVISFVIVLAGIATIFAGIISFEFSILGYGILVLISGPIFLSIVGMIKPNR